MSKKDEESVTKGTIKQFFKKYEREGAEFFLSKECFELIDALPAVPVGKDCISREVAILEVRCIDGFNLSGTQMEDHPDGDWLNREEVAQAIENLPPVLLARQALQATPSGQVRPVAEIERRIEKIIYEIEAEHYGEPATFSGEEVIQILRAICGEENEWSKLFKDEELLGEPQLKAKAKGGSR